MSSEAPMPPTTALPAFSADGGWFWDGSAWIPATPAPGEVGRPGRCAWDRTALEFRLPVPVRGLLFIAVVVVVFGAIAVTGWRSGYRWEAAVFAAFTIGSQVLRVVAALAPRELHVDVTGVEIRYRLFRTQVFPWRTVRQVGTCFQMSRQVCIDIDPAYWTERRRRHPRRRWSLAALMRSFPGSQRMIRLNSRSLPLSEADFLRCVRALAPATVSVRWELDLSRAG